MNGGGGGGPNPPTVGEEVSFTTNTHKSVAAAAAAVVAEETGSFPAAVAQDAEAGADVKEAEAEAEADDDDDGPTVMTWTEFVVAYKRLSEDEVNSILSRPRKPFESTPLYKDMIADSSTPLLKRI
ncbi:hypothetical protein BDA96_01G220000 [Sorghum bicolor]|uniref:Uncharacterized protein n=1 Tax=Sorghum bicolor TaxID=4558 RepID=A0A921S067_SORBI|nr:hypothetical protein BDA96_01G220000 [Sorghum bicolor]